MPDLCQVHLCQSAQRARQLHAQPAAAAVSAAALSGGGPRKVQRVCTAAGVAPWAITQRACTAAGYAS